MDLKALSVVLNTNTNRIIAENTQNMAINQCIFTELDKIKSKFDQIYNLINVAYWNQDAFIVNGEGSIDCYNQTVKPLYLENKEIIDKFFEGPGDEYNRGLIDGFRLSILYLEKLKAILFAPIINLTDEDAYQEYLDNSIHDYGYRDELEKQRQIDNLTRMVVDFNYTDLYKTFNISFITE